MSPYGNDSDLWKEWSWLINKYKVRNTESYGKNYLKPIFFSTDTDTVLLDEKYFMDLIFETNELDPHFKLGAMDTWNYMEIITNSIKYMEKDALTIKNVEDHLLLNEPSEILQYGDEALKCTKMNIQKIVQFLNEHLTQTYVFQPACLGEFCGWAVFLVGVSDNANVIGASIFFSL
eukprot:531144_1